MRFLLSLLFDVIVAVSLTLGVLWCDERLLNIGYFAGWFFRCSQPELASPAQMAGQLLRVNISPRTLLWRGYDVLTDTAFIVFAIWSGWYVMGAVYALQAGDKGADVCRAGT
ncbi:Uncharacterised protein [Klebsiella pneumoniae]|uniref:Uncharacterized protein n=1 Tax=Klebsiella pneumoniae TaxID=573 RepID=A0A377Y3G5_KLEPN|nr:Uncharacterised protein [Klebsiella pneumoniae]